jgi:hypothetical protein
MIPEEIEDYFLEISDMNSEYRTDGVVPIQMELVRDPFISVQVVSKYKKEIILELEEPIECKPYTDCYSGIGTTKFKQRIVEHPCIMSTKTVSCDTMKISYPSKMDKHLKKIIETAIKRLSLYYDVSDYKSKKEHNQHQFRGALFRLTSKDDSTIEVSFTMINKDEYKEFQKLVHLSKETHDVRISTKANGINNYWPIDSGK